MATSNKASVIIGTVPAVSHITPILTIARYLVAGGYEVTFISTDPFRGCLEEIGAKYMPIAGWDEYEDEAILEWLAPKGATLASEDKDARMAVAEFYLSLIPAAYESIQKAMAANNAECPGRPVILLFEPLFYGALPGLLGAPGLQPRGVISVGIMPLCYHSIDIGPPFAGHPLDSSEEGRNRNHALNEANIKRLQPLYEIFQEILKQVGARRTPLLAADTLYALSDIHLQLSPPSLEFPRADQPADLRFTYGIPRRNPQEVTASSGLPTWWEEVVINPKRKRIVAVSQGCVAQDYGQLIIPAIQGLENEEDMLVVVALGKKGATLPAEMQIPANARVADWIPFDDLLPYADIFVTNGGYGSFQNAIARGVPLVVAPIAINDKRDIAARIKWSGTGINLGMENITPERVRAAVAEIFSDPKYKKRVLEIKAEIEEHDPMAIISDAIDELARRPSTFLHRSQTLFYPMQMANRVSF